MTMMTTCTDCGFRFPEPAPGAICPECGGATDTSTVVELPIATLRITALAPTIISSSRFAASWYQDALNEVAESFEWDLQGRRREIMFAACCAESYLYEWALDRLRENLEPAAGFDKINEYFAFNPRAVQEVVATAITDLEQAEVQLQESDTTGVSNGLSATITQLRQVRGLQPPTALQQWTRIPGLLLADGYYAGEIPDFGNNNEGFQRVITIRNRITHAGISLPVIEAPTEEESRRATITVNDLAALTPGSAVGVVVERIRRPHTAVGTPPPTWLVDPRRGLAKATGVQLHILVREAESGKKTSILAQSDENPVSIRSERPPL